MVVEASETIVLKTGVSKSLVNPNLHFRLRLDISGANIRIQDKLIHDEETGLYYTDPESGLDMDFEVTKTANNRANECTITIWNLSDRTYSKIANEANAFELYGAWGDDEYALIFRGFPKKVLQHSKKQIITANEGFLKQDANAGRRGQNDQATVLTLIDGKTEYEEAFMNKTYYGLVSTETILKDCIETFGTPIGSMAEIEHREIMGMQYKEKTVSVLNGLSKLLNFHWTIINGIFYTFTDKLPTQPYGILLNSDNSQTPIRQNDIFKVKSETIQKANKKKSIVGMKKTTIEKTYNGYMISTILLPFLNPGVYCGCDFAERLQGTKWIYKLVSRGNNYGTVAETEVYVV